MKQYVDRLSVEPACLEAAPPAAQACRSGESTIAAEAFMNNAREKLSTGVFVISLHPRFPCTGRKGTVSSVKYSRFLALWCGLLFSLPLTLHAEVSGNLIIAGNGPEQTAVESLARAFEKANPRAYVDVVWDERSKPVDMVKNGQAHLAVTGAEDGDLKSTQVAWDGIAVVVHLSNFTKEVTKQQVADIFSGAVKTWSDLGGPDTKIMLIDRPRNQNLRDAFEHQLGIAGKIPDTAKVIARDDKVIKTIVGTLPPLSAVSFLSLRHALDAVNSGVAIRLLPIDKVEPELPTVKDGRYSLRRPVLLLSKKEATPLIDAFYDFVLSGPGQKIISDTYISLQTK